jgi:hypothetical protein
MVTVQRVDGNGVVRHNTILRCIPGPYRKDGKETQVQQKLNPHTKRSLTLLLGNLLSGLLPLALALGLLGSLLFFGRGATRVG